MKQSESLRKRYVLVVDVELEPKEFDFGKDEGAAEEREGAIEDAWQEVEDGLTSVDTQRAVVSVMNDWYAHATSDISIGGGIELVKGDRLAIHPDKRLVRNRSKRPSLVARGI